MYLFDSSESSTQSVDMFRQQFPFPLHEVNGEKISTAFNPVASVIGHVCPDSLPPFSVSHRFPIFRCAKILYVCVGWVEAIAETHHTHAKPPTTPRRSDLPNVSNIRDTVPPFLMGFVSLYPSYGPRAYCTL
jgi:hypothetical protein